CGIIGVIQANWNPHPRVVNGTNAKIEEFPFLVSLRQYNRHICGASIIDESWVLTAAHCLDDSASVYTVQFASTYLDPKSSNIVDVEAFYRHEMYNPSDKFINDIALVKLSSPIVNKIFEWKVKLPINDASFSTGTPAVLTGWGRNETEGETMRLLQKVDLKIYTSSDCSKLHGQTIYPTNICAGVDGGLKGQCGDKFFTL
ncbi:chymotrypsin BII-like, partial [Chironomus tepperi]|uniref:chymotrypsin BII-like n=1 Tax=Chironomus tepperi TaxID=113505 RepID=UPI00391EE39A